MSLASLHPVIFLITECHSRLNSVGSGLPIRLAIPKLVTPSLRVRSLVGWSGVYALRRGLIQQSHRRSAKKRGIENERGKEKERERREKKKKREEKNRKKEKEEKKKRKKGAPSSTRVSLLSQAIGLLSDFDNVCARQSQEACLGRHLLVFQLDQGAAHVILHQKALRICRGMRVLAVVAPLLQSAPNTNRIPLHTLTRVP